MFLALISLNLELRFKKKKNSWFRRGKIALALKRTPIVRHIITHSAMGKIILSKDDKSTTNRTMLLR